MYLWYFFSFLLKLVQWIEKLLYNGRKQAKSEDKLSNNASFIYIYSTFFSLNNIYAGYAVHLEENVEKTGLSSIVTGFESKRSPTVVLDL